MHYSLHDIKTFHDSVKQCSVTALATRMQTSLPDLTEGIQYQTDQTEQIEEVLDLETLGVDPTVLHIAVNNLAAFLLTTDRNEVTHIPFEWADKMGDEKQKQFFEQLAEWIQSDDQQSVTNLVYLAHYEADIRNRRKIDSGDTVLPGEKTYRSIKQLTHTLMTTMNHPKQLISKVDNVVTYNEVVNKGHIDFLVGDTLYLSRLGSIQPRDNYALLISYMLVKSSARYQDTTINHVCLVNLLNGTRLQVDITQVSDATLEAIRGCLYGPKQLCSVEPTPSTTWTDKAKRLIMQFAKLFSFQR